MLGTMRHRVDAAAEYLRLAKEDEGAAQVLHRTGQHRHAILLYLQAMEKFLRAHIFARVDATNPYFRERHRNHSLEDALTFFLEVCSTDPQVREQLRTQLHTYVIGDLRFNQLHNALRYPSFSERHQSYSCLHVAAQDADLIAQRLTFLKQFLRDSDRIR